MHSAQDQASWRRLTVDCSSVNWWWLAQSSLQLTNKLQAKSVLILFPFHNNALLYRYLKWRRGSKDLRSYLGIERGTSPVILLQMVMVCSGTHLVKNHESHLKKSLKLKMLWPLCNHTVNLKTDSKTLSYSILKLKYSSSILKHNEGEKNYTSLSNSHNNCHRNYTNRILLTHMFRSINWSLHPMGRMPWIILRLWGLLCVRVAGGRGNKIAASHAKGPSLTKTGLSWTGS